MKVFLPSSHPLGLDSALEPSLWGTLLLGFALGLAIAWVAWRAGALNVSGFVAAALSGGVIFGLGGLGWAVLLLAFFISSSALSRAFAHRKASLSEKFSKGHRRDAAQVAANGGLAVLLALLHPVFPEKITFWVAFAGAMTAVNADTWATELGVLSPSPPRLITNGRPVERGASGGVSVWGSVAALSGSGLIALLAALLAPAKNAGVGQSLGVALAVLLGGVAGSFADSLAGATVQAIYWCPTCAKETERHPQHTCGVSTTLYRGWRWFNNDWVNFFASLVGASVAAALFTLF